MNPRRMMMRDPAVFPDGDAFKPERFLNVTDPRLQTYKFGVFGFGRRICPGMYVALQSLYIAMARYVEPSFLASSLTPSFHCL